MINPQCTFAHLMDSDGMIINTVGNSINNLGDSSNGQLETITIENPAEGLLSEFAISSCEGNVHEIRIYQNITSNIQIASNDEALTVYPNPVHHHMTIAGAAGMEVRITDTFGRLILTKTIIGDKELLEVSDFSAGIYFLTFYKEEVHFLTKKIMKRP